MISGIAAIIGLPVIINDVIGVMTERAIAQDRPTVSTHMMRQVFIIGPVM